MRKVRSMKMFFVAVLVLLTSCGMTNEQSVINIAPMERALIVGSAEPSDPVLTQVMKLEKNGIVQDVVVHESFPVQIRLTAPKKVIDELNRIPRIGGMLQEP